MCSVFVVFFNRPTMWKWQSIGLPLLKSKCQKMLTFWIGACSTTRYSDLEALAKCRLTVGKVAWFWFPCSYEQQVVFCLRHNTWFVRNSFERGEEEENRRHQQMEKNILHSEPLPCCISQHSHRANVCKPTLIHAIHFGIWGYSMISVSTDAQCVGSTACLKNLRTAG